MKSLEKARIRKPLSISDYQISCYDGTMRTITATEASRNFKKLLDAVEGGESVAITRGGDIIAEISPRKRRTAKDLFDALDKLELPPLSDEEHENFARSIDEANKFMIEDWQDRVWLGD